MNYTDELVGLLRPLGVYSFREGSFSLAELQALGTVLNEADEMFAARQKETIVMTAEEEGLSRVEALFRSRCGNCGISDDQRRQLHTRSAEQMPLRVRHGVQGRRNGTG